MRSSRPRFPPLEAMVVPLTTCFLFGVFAGAGLACRKRPDAHKRFMMLATIAMLPAAIGRAMGWLFGDATPALFFGAIGFFVLAIVIYDRRTRGRVHPVTLWGRIGARCCHSPHGWRLEKRISGSVSRRG